MSGTDSYIGNAVASEIQESPSQTSMRLAYSAAGSALYAPPLAMVPPTNSSELLSPTTYQPANGVSGSSAVAVVAQPTANNNTGEVIKRKRGRPRKYALTEGTKAPPVLTSQPPPVQSSGFTSPNTAAPVSSGKKARGRPPGSSRKQQVAAVAVAASGSAGVGFTPHIITVKAGEDVLAKLMSFSQHNKRAVCILSANGAISNVTLRQAATSGGTVTYEGRFEILSLSGSFLLSESGGQRSRIGGLSVSLAGPDGRVLGGGVAGLLTAASPIQVIAASFMAAGQKPSKSGHNEVFPAPPKLASNASVAGSPPSRATLSESLSGPGSPINHSTGGYNNSNSQTIYNMGWR